MIQKNGSDERQVGTVTLVTGANQGIGLQIAKELAASGHIVYLGSRDIQKGELAAQTIDGNVHPIQLDVTDATSINNAVEKIKNEKGYLDLLINNAAISHIDLPGRTINSLEEGILSARASVASIEEMKAVWETNVFGVLALTQAMLPLLRKSKSARILNISSGVGSLTLNSDTNFPYRQGFGVIYPASKTALNAITVALAIELEPENIKVNAASPGFTNTALNNFQGTDSIEVGSQNPIRAALELDGPTCTFTGPDGVMPW
ncbi:MAG: dehydrogenase [Pseudopedobacter saltans]|uniref:Dehydrogenase n=1 Tax=Pseudopedobacter saltans TaxID=151895 RepID=A0A2W5EUX6_9SPHI|nr:MAG: dehydrogenase [Pseudopedobacter saltans]